MRTFSMDEIKALGRQSRLALRDKEILRLQKDLESFSIYIKKLEEIPLPKDPEALEGQCRMHKNKSPLRKDREENFKELEILRNNAPKNQENYITVPKIME